MSILFRALSLLLGYIFGLFITAYFFGRLKGIDVRQSGSGNPGATNVLRTMGSSAGVIVFIGDALKAVIAAIAAALLFGDKPLFAPGNQIFIIWAGLGVILGHDYPFYMKFKGGKGISSMLGLFLILDWRTALIGLLVFIVVVFTTKYVSLGSLLGTLGFFTAWVIFCILGLEPLNGDQIIEVSIIACFLCVLTFIRHKANIKRLLSKTEKKIGSKEV